MTDVTPARVRFAPSPTGRFHLGSARSALYDFLYARKTSGKFVLRIEDTDRRRFDPKAEGELIEGLHWLGVQWDEGPDVGGPFGPYRQSERLDRYQECARELVAGGHAYYCFCSVERLAQLRQAQQRSKQPPHYDGLCRRIPPDQAHDRTASGEPHVVRFKTPKEGTTTGIDLLRGPITVENRTIDDYILLKSDGMPVYHLAHLVDDHDMQISHVLRGSEWLPTFPLHVLIYQAFGWDQPVWVHLSVFLNPSGKGKMSKRHAVDSKGGAMSIYPLDMRQMGYLPEAIVNWIALMGWSYDDRTELFTLDDLVERFSLEKLNPSPAAVNFSKLEHFNGVYIRGLSTEDLSGRLEPFFRAAGLEPDAARLRAITPLIRERINTLEDAVEIAGFFFRPRADPDAQQLVGKNMDARSSAEAARQAGDVISRVETIDPAILEPRLRELADRLNLTAGQLFGLLRIAVTGQPVSPPLIETMHILGRDEVVARIDRAVALLEQVRGGA